MGYRSEVALAVSAKALPHLMAKLATCEKALKMVFNEGNSLDTNYQKTGGLLVTWEFIKWYSNYEEITCIEDFMNDMDSMADDKGCDMDEQYRFCRIGENMDDIEERGYLESFDIRRTIAF